MKEENKLFGMKYLRWGRIELFKMPLLSAIECAKECSKKKIYKIKENNNYSQYKVFNWDFCLYKRYLNNNKRDFDWNFKIYKV